MRCEVRRYGAAYIPRDDTAVCSAYSRTCEDCEKASCTTASSRPSRLATNRTCETVGGRYPT